MPDVTDRLSVELAAAAAELGDDGRVLVRPSGTEPVVRVMVEATEHEQAERIARRAAPSARSAGDVAG